MAFRETARAKVNLTLSVLGRRPDGYHEIESLVAFAGIGDRVTLTPGRECRVLTSGPFAGDIEGPNLLETALDRLRDLDAGLQLGTVLLEKNLPVAAGLGGGSADAAALLRAARRANRGRACTSAGRPFCSFFLIFSASSGSGLSVSAWSHWKRASRSRPTRQ